MYGLLDLSWDHYTQFCDDYEQHGLSSLLEGACKADIHPHLATATADEMSEVKQQLQTAQQSCEEAAQKAQQVYDDVLLKLSKETRLLDELWGLFKCYKTAIGRSCTGISQYTSSKKAISAELKQRLPDLN